MPFPYTPMSAGPFGTILMPMMSIRLTNGTTFVDEIGLVDTGSAVNVLPYDLGIRLGLDWNAPAQLLSLAGNVGRQTAKAAFLMGTVAGFPPVSLIFAWSQAPDTRLILGQTNFLAEFDACFFRSRGVFEVQPRP